MIAAPPASLAVPKMVAVSWASMKRPARLSFYSAV